MLVVGPENFLDAISVSEKEDRIVVEFGQLGDEQPQKMVATRSVYVGGDAVNSIINTGDGNTVGGPSAGSTSPPISLDIRIPPGVDYYIHGNGRVARTAHETVLR